MEFSIHLGTDERVIVDTGEHVVVTGQEGVTPSPFVLFLASIGACAGTYVARFCRERGIPTRGIRLRQRHEHEPGSNRVRAVLLELELPDDFPAKYRDAVVRAAELCTVKRHLADPPRVEVRTPTAVGD